MTIRSKIFLAIILFFPPVYASSQNLNSSLRKVNIGDNAPNYLLTNLINYSEVSLNLNGIKGKILILDFWNSSCTSCLESWPKLIKLQAKYKEQIQIILVNPTEELARIKKIVALQEKIYGYKMSLAISYGNEDITVLFPHTFVPHVIYINPVGVVEYITTGVTEGIIDGVLSRKSLTLPEKIDDYADIIWSKPLFINGNTAKDDVGQNVLFSTIITPYSASMYPRIDFIDSKRNILDGRTMGLIANRSLIDMFQYLYGRDWMTSHWVYPVPISRIAFKDVDTTKLVRTVNGIPQFQNLYTIQVTAKNDIPIQKVREKMIDDLEASFGLKTAWKKQKKMSFVFSRASSGITEYQNGLDSILMGGHILNFNNIGMQDFIDRLIYYTPALKDYPVVDETNFLGKLGNIKLSKSHVASYTSLAKELLKYGLKISIQERETEVLVISGGDK